MVATLKKRDIQKMKKTPGDTIKKVLNPKYGPNWSSGFRGIRGDRQTDRQTDRHTHPKKPLFCVRGVIKRVDPSKVGGRVFGVITILPLYYFVVRESKNQIHECNNRCMVKMQSFVYRCDCALF